MHAYRLVAFVLSLAVAVLLSPRPTLAFCSSDPTTPPDIAGTWEWTDTHGGIGGAAITPEQAGYTAQLNFRDDGWLFAYRNEELVFSSRYRVQLQPAGWTVSVPANPAFPHPPLQRDNGFFCISLIETPEGLRLQAHDICLDCWSSRFEVRDPVPVAQQPWGRVKKLYKE